MITVKSASEAPVVAVARQSVALVGQEIVIPINVSDLDQDALSYLAQGLPAGARIVLDAQYGHASIRWTPTVAQATAQAGAGRDCTRPRAQRLLAEGAGRARQSAMATI